MDLAHKLGFRAHISEWFFNKQIYEAAYKECYPSLLPVAVINTVTTSNWGGKGPGHTPSQQELRAGIEAETIEEHGYWLTLSLMLSQRSHTAQAHLPRG